MMNRLLHTLGYSIILLSSANAMANNLATDAPQTPVVTSPSTNTVFGSEDSIEFTWQSAEALSDINAPTAFDAFIYDTETKIFAWRDTSIDANFHCDSSTACNITIPVSLPPSNRYVFRIKAKNSTGLSAWSRGVQIDVVETVRTPPSTPTITSPSAGSVFETYDSFEFSWELSEGMSDPNAPTVFDAFVYDPDDKTFLWRNRNIDAVSHCDENTTCSITLPESIPVNDRYIFRVKAKNSAGQSAWSKSLLFAVEEKIATAPSIPTISSPTANHQFDRNNELPFVWQSAEVLLDPSAPTTFDAFVYDIDSKNFIWRDQNIDASTNCDIYTTCNIKVPVSVPPNKQYVFRVRAINSIGKSAWSRSLRFEVTPANDLTALGQCTNATTATKQFAGNLEELISGGTPPYTYELTGKASRGSVELDYTSGDFTYYPNDKGRGYMDSFDVKVSDRYGQEAKTNISFVYGTRRIMPVGDSITFGVTNYNHTTGDYPKSDYAVGYRKRLKELLTEDGYIVDFVGPKTSGKSAGLDDAEHAGYPGWTSWHIANGRAGREHQGHLT